MGAELTPDTMVSLMQDSMLAARWALRASVYLPNGRVAADESPRRTDDGRVVRDFKLEYLIKLQ